MMKKLVSIIIPIYNAEDYIEDCLNSILKQGIKEIEVLLINDGSTDNSERICLQYCKKFNIFSYFYKTNTGVSDTRNFGISKAVGKFICFIDSDDILSDNYLSDFIIAAEINPDSELLCCDYIKFVDFEDIKMNNDCSSVLRSSQLDQGEKYDVLFNKYGGYLWNKIFKKELIERNELKFCTDLYMCEDMIFIFEYLQHINQVTLISKKNYYYRLHNVSSGKNKANPKWFSVLDACEKLLLGRECFNTNQVKNFAYFYNYMVCKSKYRLRYISQEKESLKGKVRKSQNNARTLRSYLTLFQKIKIHLYGTFYFPIFLIKRD